MYGTAFCFLTCFRVHSKCSLIQKGLFSQWRWARNVSKQKRTFPKFNQHWKILWNSLYLLSSSLSFCVFLLSCSTGLMIWCHWCLFGLRFRWGLSEYAFTSYLPLSHHLLLLALLSFSKEKRIIVWWTIYASGYLSWASLLAKSPDVITPVPKKIDPLKWRKKCK